MARTLAAMLDQRALALPGRERERAALLRLVRDDTPLVAFVHGIAGVGKSTLLRALAADARAGGAATVEVDAREVEPTNRGVLTAIATAAGSTAETPEELGADLGALGARVLVVVDTYELLGMVDAWVSSRLVPAFPTHVRVVLAGREPPQAPWHRVYGDLLLVLPLGSLDPEHGEALLVAAGAEPDDAAWLNQRVRGHPLSLQLVAGSLTPGGPARRDVGAAVEELAREYLDGLDPATLHALHAASITRRTTVALLAAMLPEDDAGAAFGRLRALPFVELGRDGLVVHDTVRQATAALLRAGDPARADRYRTAAWRVLRDEVRRAGADRWRATADLLYLVDDPLVRDFFFTASVADHVVEPARPGDWPAIVALVTAHREASDVETWWSQLPRAFSVARDARGEVSAFGCTVDQRDVPVSLVEVDPMLQRWRGHLRRDPVPRGQRVLFHRFLTARDDCRWGPGSPGPSPGRAALLLDAKAREIELMTDLRRTYAAEPSLAGAYGLCALTLGYETLADEDLSLGDPSTRSLLLDLGPGLMDGYLASLAARHLPANAGPLDAGARELVLDGRRVALTPLEFGVLRYLHEREGRVVARDELLREVWGHAWTGGSNVVDVVVSALRRKLRDRAGALETVRGAGYRLGTLI